MLMTHDRVKSDQMDLTQEFLSTMLGIERSGVTLAAITLQDDGLIKYSRGKITVIDRARLEHASCECYGRVKNLIDDLLKARTR